MEIIIGKEYNIQSINYAADEGLFCGVVIESIGNTKRPSYRIRTTQYSFHTKTSMIGKTVLVTADRILSPVASTNKGFVSLLSKEG